MMHYEEDFVKFIGQQEVELIICLSRQYPEEAEACAKYLLDKYVKFEIRNALLEALKK